MNVGDNICVKIVLITLDLELTLVTCCKHGVCYLNAFTLNHL